jgi:uncharacterized sulfatase
VVEYADILPTLLELSGSDLTNSGTTLDGTSFAAVLRGERDTHRKFAYGTHNNLPEGPAFPSRTVTDGQWRYIRNLSPERIYVQKYVMGTQGNGELNNPYWGTWVFSSADHPETYRLVKRYMTRPAEELYHTTEDAFEMNNLAGDPKYADIKARLSAELNRWLAEQGDPGVPLDTSEALQAAKNGRHQFSPRP